MNEEWRPCTVDEGYDVSSLGRIRAIERADFRGECSRASAFVRILKPGMLKPTVLSTGYQQVTLGERRKFSVHRLVALAFLANPERKAHVNHKNGKRDDNRVENLEWATVRENALHSFRELGRKIPSEGQGRCLTFNGKSQTIRAWAQELNLPLTLIYCRIGVGWSAERALATPPLKGKNKPHFSDSPQTENAETGQPAPAFSSAPTASPLAGGPSADGNGSALARPSAPIGERRT